jgi:hypothetical protein
MLRGNKRWKFLSVMAASTIVAGCAGRGTDDQVKVQGAIQRLQSGALVSQIENNRLKTDRLARGANRDAETRSEPQVEGRLTRPDPCPNAPSPVQGASDEALAEAMTKLGACFRDLMKAAGRISDALFYFKTFLVPEGQKALSEMTDGEIESFLETNLKAPEELFGTESALATRFRDRYSDAELDELFRLAARRTMAYSSTEEAVYAALEARPALVDKYKTLNRYALLLTLKATAADRTGLVTARKVAELLRASEMAVPRSLSGFPVKLLHPYALVAAVPDEGDELKPLHPGENPFEQVSRLTGDLAGTDEWLSMIRQAYVGVRDQDNPPLPAHEPAAADAIRVAFLDTGIDYLQYPDLALFAGNGEQGQLGQKDYGDHDDNSWVPGVGLLDHGSGTMATLLTLVAHHAPEVLRERKLDVAMWKVGSARSLLTGPPVSQLARFDTRHLVSFLEAIADRVENRTGAAPRIVSVSAAFPTERFLQQAQKPNLIQDSTWLWVMAAGNEGENVSENRQACFEDVPAERRAGARLLCVGALSRGIINDRITAYSNYGDRVDVYAYESYTGLCPNGTSCATPAVSAAAAVVAAKFPRLTPEQIKEVIVETSETRTLAVEVSEEEAAMLEAMGVRPERTVRVYDPVTMLARTLENAARKAGTVNPAP